MPNLSVIRKSKGRGLTLSIQHDTTCSNASYNAFGRRLIWIYIVTRLAEMVLLKENYRNIVSYKTHIHHVTWRRVVVFRVLRFISGGNYRFQLNRMLGVSKTIPENSKEGSILAFLGNRPLPLSQTRNPLTIKSDNSRSLNVVTLEPKLVKPYSQSTNVTLFRNKCRTSGHDWNVLLCYCHKLTTISLHILLNILSQIIIYIYIYIYSHRQLASANPAAKTRITLSFHLITIVLDYPFQSIRFNYRARQLSALHLHYNR
jgi:hypothetical protein